MEVLETLPSAATRRIGASPLADQVARALLLAIAIALPALLCLHMSFVTDADVWWHMRTGQWILTHRAVPHADPFSRLAGQPWAAYSWLFDLLVLTCFQHFSLIGIVIYSTTLVLAIAVALFHLFKRLQPDLSLSALLVCVSGFALMRLYTPRAWLFTILFFTIQLNILLHVRKTGKSRELLWLPPLYALWANIHIQFIDGLVVLTLAFGESILARWLPSVRTRLSAAWITCIWVACILATLVNPYCWQIYKVGYGLASQRGVLTSLAELHALVFRSLPDYLMLFLALAAAAALAASHTRSRDSGYLRFPLFEAALLAFAAIVSFRTGRDMWVMVISACAILASSLGRHSEPKQSPRLLTPITTATFAVILVPLLFTGSRIFQVNSTRLQSQIVDNMPVRAVDIVRQNNYSGPLFNNFDWGGYLIWSLHMPVSMDGRADFWGDQLLDRSFATWDGASSWASDPDLASAGLVIAPIAKPLTQLLRTDPRFQLAYEDNVAAVFIARRLHETPVTPTPSLAY